VAFAGSNVIAWGIWQVGRLAMLLALFVLLTLLLFVVFSIAPDAIAAWRGHSWRWWWRASDDEGPFWQGTRIPRNP